MLTKHHVYNYLWLESLDDDSIFKYVPLTKQLKKESSNTHPESKNFAPTMH